MYSVAKLLQLAGIMIIGAGFVIRFPKVMDPKLFAVGILLSLSGWLIQRYILKR